MQRIDEDTYIDNTLVTCAEYQLFIDEMYEQGKYYHPAHWTVYQFPRGQARKPILGVWYSDATAFCKWLTQRESAKWRYRVPTQKEAGTFQMKDFGNNPLGYWIIGSNHQGQLNWIGPVPKDARRIEVEMARSLDQIRARTNGLDMGLYNACEHAINRALNRALNLDLARDLDINLYLDRLAYDISDPAHLFDFNSDEAGALDIYIDVFTLKARIAGHSPAFEGIRLVKERTR